MNQTVPPAFSDAYSFQEQVQQLVYNFKMHPIYAYNMLINQRLKQGLVIRDGTSPELVHNTTPNFHDQFNQSQQQQQLLDTNSLQYSNQYDHYAHYNQQNMIAYQNQTAAASFMHKHSNYQHQISVPNQLKFSQMNISPIPYILPQTPPNSFNQTPIIKKQTDEKNFNSFVTPPSSGSFSYYTNMQHH